MSYCKSCGAYIPDGQTRCLACGKTEEETQQEQRRAQGGAATAARTKSADTSGEYHYASEKMKQELEKQRQRQQDYDRRWAEAEKQRRERERAENERARVRKNESAAPDIAPETARILAVLSYLWIGCFIPMLACRDNEFAMFHAKQGLRLFIVGTVVEALASIIGLGWVVSFGWLVLAYKGMKNALNGKKEPLPYIGK